MRLKIRWKLILGIGLPVMAVYGVILALDYRALRRAALEQTEREAATAADLCAARLDGTLERIAQVARSAADFLQLRPSMTEPEITALLTDNVVQEPWVFGSCLAFEPGAFDLARGLFATYAYRSGETIATKVLAPSYDYTLEKWEWYSRPRKTLKPGWTEPYLDEGGGDIIMCTYSVPVVRDERLVAVMTVDLDVTGLQAALGGTALNGAEFAILSRGGRFISHPDPAMVMKGTAVGNATATGRDDLVALADKMLSGQRGADAVKSAFRPGKSDLIFYSPIPSPGWSFVALRDLDVAMADVMTRLGERGAILGSGMIAIFAVIYLMGTVITRPVGALMGGVRALAAGRLDATVEGVHRRDELGELADTFNTMTAKLKGQVEALASARAAREAVESELRVAKDIQTSLLPRTFPGPPEHEGFDLFAVCIPAKAVGGDFYDFFLTAQGDLYFIIADVSGKGVPAALYMAVSRTLIRNLARAGHGPAEILTRANNILSSEHESNGMFLTTFIGAYRPSNGALRYANAGHPPPLRLAKGSPTAQLGEPLNTALGIVPDTVYVERTDAMIVGERLVLFTDGVSEARAPGGEFFGDSRTESLAVQTSHLKPSSACDECIKALEEFQAGGQADDITLMILERRT